MSLRLAMWSGPRNLSTALMRSFGARADAVCVDEPFYAAFLAVSGIDHPMRAEILAAGEADPARVAEACLAPPPPGKAVVYQKHMTHHMLPGFDLGWTAGVTNAFLIRDPLRVAASYEAKREAATLDDLGVARQLELFRREADRLGAPPPVLDAARVLADPEAVLRAFCARVGLGFEPAMLAWAPGPRPEDGVWAPHWYGSVWRSTGFGPPEADRPLATDAAKRLADEARPYYEALAPHAL